MPHVPYFIQSWVISQKPIRKILEQKEIGRSLRIKSRHRRGCLRTHNDFIIAFTAAWQPSNVVWSILKHSDVTMLLQCWADPLLYPHQWLARLSRLALSIIILMDETLPINAA